MSFPDQKSNRQYAMLVTFQWGTTTIRYAAYTAAVTYNEFVYSPLPSLSIKLGKIQGGVSDDPTEIEMPLSASPATTLARPYPHAPVTVTIDELDPSADDSLRNLFKGKVSEVLANANGKTNMVRLKVASVKALFEVPLGIMADTSCVWNFGTENDSPCAIDLTPLKFSGTISEIAGSVITITSEYAVATRYLHRGFVELNGLRIMIVDGLGKVLTLARIPPPEWVVGTVLTVCPGCDKSLTTCRSWSNEGNFGGCGYAMPSYNPVFSKGG